MPELWKDELIFLVSGLKRSEACLYKNKGDVKWLKGTQINRPDEAMIKKWLDEVL